MKIYTLFAILILFAYLAGSCNPAAPDTSLLVPQNPINSTLPTASPKANKYTIALVMKTLTNPYFVEMEKGARKAEGELGINLLVKTGAQETSIEQQVNIIQGLIKDRVDAIVIAPADSTQLIPVLKDAQQAGIVIINVDNQLNPQASEKIGLVGVPYISVDNENGAYLSAKAIADQVTTPTQAIILEGIRTAKNAEDRKNGALRAFSENKNIQIVAMETAHWKIDEAYQVAAQLFKQYPDVNLVFCANDMMALGVIQYLKENGKTQVKVAAYDALDEAKQMLQEGELQATIDQQAALQAYTAIQYAVQALKGEQLPPVTLLDVQLLTKDILK
jgi:ribose transport system substrate-binding protein